MAPGSQPIHPGATKMSVQIVGLDLNRGRRRSVGRMSFRYLGYQQSRDVPNVVVDGAANESTALTLSHWPGAPTPVELKRDVSAEIAFAYLDAPCEHAPAEIVTNNHFDVDGRQATRIVLGDWYEQGSVLHWAAGNYHLESLPR